MKRWILRRTHQNVQFVLGAARRASGIRRSFLRVQCEVMPWGVTTPTFTTPSGPPSSPPPGWVLASARHRDGTERALARGGYTGTELVASEIAGSGASGSSSSPLPARTVWPPVSSTISHSKADRRRAKVTSARKGTACAESHRYGAGSPAPPCSDDAECTQHECNHPVEDLLGSDDTRSGGRHPRRLLGRMSGSRRRGGSREDERGDHRSSHSTRCHFDLRYIHFRCRRGPFDAPQSATTGITPRKPGRRSPRAARATRPAR